MPPNLIKSDFDMPVSCFQGPELLPLKKLVTVFAYFKMRMPPNLIKSDFDMLVSCFQGPELLPPLWLHPIIPRPSWWEGGLKEVLLPYCTSLAVNATLGAAAVWIYTPTMSCIRKSNAAAQSLKGVGLKRRRTFFFVFSAPRFLGPRHPELHEQPPSPKIESNNCCVGPDTNECVCFYACWQAPPA
jgi:hypothetical protein